MLFKIFVLIGGGGKKEKGVFFFIFISPRLVSSIWMFVLEGRREVNGMETGGKLDKVKEKVNPD